MSDQRMCTSCTNRVIAGSFRKRRSYAHRCRPVRGEGIECCADGLAHSGTRRMAAALDDLEACARPGPGQLPREHGRSAEVESSMDEDGRDVGERSGVVEQLPLVEPGVVAEVVGTDAGEGHALARVGLEQ